MTIKSLLKTYWIYKISSVNVRDDDGNLEFAEEGWVEPYWIREQLIISIVFNLKSQDSTVDSCISFH